MAKDPKEGKRARLERYRRFCLEYVKDFNASRSYVAAGFSDKNPNVDSQRLLANSSIKKNIEKLVAERSKKIDLDGDKILMKIKTLAESDLRILFDDDGCVIPVKEWPDNIALAVSSIKVKELFNNKGKLIGYTKELKLWDKVKSLEMLGRYLQLFQDSKPPNLMQVNVTVTDEQVKNIVMKLLNDY